MKKTNPITVAEFHFSPLEHALFDEMKSEAETALLLERFCALGAGTFENKKS